MRRLLLTIVLLGLPLAAQDMHVQPPAPNQQKLFILKYADPRNLSDLLRIFSNAQMIANTEMHALAVTAPESTMKSIEEAIAKLDVSSAAPRNFDFSVYLVVGMEGENVVSGGIPRDLDSVVTQLKGSFSFKNYRVLDVLNIRARSGQKVSTRSSGGTVQLGSVGRSVNSYFALRAATLGTDGTTIHVDNLSCSSQVPFEVRPGEYNMENLALDTDIDIKEGQKVVVGRMGMTGQQAMFVVMTVKVVQ